MKTLGVIVEYNPLHNGHEYHLQQSILKSDADVTIAVMSGSFLQRGEPALVSKWTRTKMSLMSGIDIVIELPYPFATQKAETFANGAVSILESLGCDYVCFGSESGDIDTFYHSLTWMEQNNVPFNTLVKKALKDGNSYPRAMSIAFNTLNVDQSALDLSQPNNILGYHYVKAIYDQNASMKAITIKRHQAGYHDEHFSSNEIASATSIRKAIFSETNDVNKINQYVPYHTYELLLHYLSKYETFHHWEMYWPLLQYRLFQLTPSELSKIYEIEEGIEHRFISAAIKAQSFEQFIGLVKTKRYTRTRLQRMCVHILTNANKEEMLSKKTASYARLLGMSKLGQNYLKKNKEHFSLPIISTLSSYKEKDIELDIRASRIHSLGVRYPIAQTLISKEYKQPPIRYDEKEKRFC